MDSVVILKIVEQAAALCTNHELCHQTMNCIATLKTPMGSLPRPSSAPRWAYDAIILPCWRASAADRISWTELGLSIRTLVAKNPMPRAILAGYVPLRFFRWHEMLLLGGCC
jgi:hypothetical protein